MRIEKTVFISYRRTNLPWALAIYQDLTHHGYDVFFDYESIKSGDFEQIIVQNIKGRAHFVVILTPSALERCNESGDWLRREIETAIDEKRNIVPLFLEGFSFSSPTIAQYLTGKLETLKKYNGLNVPVDYFEAAMARLRDDRLDVGLEAVLHPISITVQRVVEQQQIAANEAKLVARKELTAQEWFEQGYKHGELQNYDEAIHCYTETIQLQPDYALAYYNRGVNRGNKGDFDGAIKDSTEAIRIKPDYANAYCNRGVNRGNKGDFDGAIKDLTEAIRIKPDFVLAYYNRGVNRGNKGDFDGAIKDYTETIRLQPDYADAYYNRGVNRGNKGDFDGAIKDYTEAIRIKPDFVLAYYNRGVNRGNKGDFDGAIKDYTEAIRIKPDYAFAYYSRGLNRGNKGDFDGAIKDYTEAIRINPSYVDFYWGRGVAWDKKEDYYSAAADYQKYFDLGGREERVRDFLNNARKKFGK